jgi:MoaA/NifB/PqqE/SkfB family radical SAM enzyme
LDAYFCREIKGMFSNWDYWRRGATFVHNQVFPGRKHLSTFMIYATDLCDSACKHCLIWAKRPAHYLPKEKIYELVTQSRCITANTRVGLEGGEFLLHPDALEIMAWFKQHHPKFDLFSNCLQPDKLIEGVKAHTPERLYISLDGTKNTYLYMRGKDGYEKVLRVIAELHDTVPIAVMFTLSPYNDLHDLEHVAVVCKKYGVDLRVGIYNNVAFFDTLDKAHETDIGSAKNEVQLKFGDLKNLAATQHATLELKQDELEGDPSLPRHNENSVHASLAGRIPAVVNDYPENYEYLALYDSWRKKQTRIRCMSILDSLVVFPSGDVPICQYLDLQLGNVFNQSLDIIFNSPAAQNKQKLYSHNCNQCWLAFHRKYDISLYRQMEKMFGRWATTKLLGYYQWQDQTSAN